MRLRTLAVMGILIPIGGCASLLSPYPPQFDGRHPLWIYPKDVDAWVVPDEVGYSIPCTKASHNYPPPSHNFHCHPWLIQRSTVLFSKGELVTLIVQRPRDAVACTIANPCVSPVRPCERPCVGLSGDTAKAQPVPEAP
jgi:hypothetical protein